MFHIILFQAVPNNYMYNYYLKQYWQLNEIITVVISTWIQFSEYKVHPTIEMLFLHTVIEEQDYIQYISIRERKAKQKTTTKIHANLYMHKTSSETQHV